MFTYKPVFHGYINVNFTDAYTQNGKKRATHRVGMLRDAEPPVGGCWGGGGGGGGGDGQEVEVIF